MKYIKELSLDLRDTKEEEIVEMVDFFKGVWLKILAPNHCTGFNAIEVMSEMLPKEMKLVAGTDFGTFYTRMVILDMHTNNKIEYDEYI